MPADPSHAEVAQMLHKHRLAVSASDLHGSLTGYLCAGGQADADDWLDALHIDCDEAYARGDALLQALYRACRAQLQGADVQPLLPAPAAPLAGRADALVEWCRGFLGGFGLGGASGRMRLSAAANDVLADFGRVAASRFDRADDNEEEEAALADVLHFAANGAALLYREVATGADQRSVH